VSSQRPVRLPRDQRRSQLLDTAGAVFAAKGYHATAMDDIAEAAGVSKPVLYQHFGSKLDLYLALLDAACDELGSAIDGALAGTEDNAARVSATMAAFFDFVVGDPATADGSAAGSFRLIFESDLAGETRVQERIGRALDEISDSVAVVITSDTNLSGDRAKLLAVTLVGMAQVSARYWLGSGHDGATPAIDPVEAQRLVSTLAWRGIAGFPLVSHEPGRQPTTDPLRTPAISRSSP